MKPAIKKTGEDPALPEKSLTEQIAAFKAAIMERRAEVKRLDAESAEATDPDAAVNADMRARAIERYLARQEEGFTDLVRRRHAEQLIERYAAIDALAESKLREAEAAAEELRRLVDAQWEATSALACGGLQNAPPNCPEGLTGRGLLGWRPEMRIPAASLHLPEIDASLFVRRQQIARGAAALKASDRGEPPSMNVDVGMSLVEFRDALPPFELERIALGDDPDAVDFMSEAEVTSAIS